MVEDRAEKCKCGLAVWRHEDVYERVIKLIDVKNKSQSLSTLNLLRKELESVGENCQVNVEKGLERIEDAKWNIKHEKWMDAKWDVLFASTTVLDDVRKCAEETS